MREQARTVERRERVTRHERVGLRQRFDETCAMPLLCRVSPQDVAVFFRILAVMVRSRLTLHQALMLVERQSRSPVLRRVMRECHEHVARGGRLSDVLAAFPWIFSSTQVHMVRGAEETGRVDRVLDNLNRYLERALDMRRDVLGTAVTPLVALTIDLLIVGSTGVTRGIPALAFIVTGRYASALDALRDTVGFAACVWAGALLLVVAYRVALQFWRPARRAYELRKAEHPLLRPFWTARFCRVFSSTFAAGLPISSAIAAAGDASGSITLQEAAHKAAHLTSTGVSLGAAFDQAGFPPDIVQHARTGEVTGNADALLDHLAGDLEDRAQARLFAVVQTASWTGVLMVLTWAALAAFALAVGGPAAGARP